MPIIHHFSFLWMGNHQSGRVSDSYWLRHRWAVFLQMSLAFQGRGNSSEQSATLDRSSLLEEAAQLTDSLVKILLLIVLAVTTFHIHGLIDIYFVIFYAKTLLFGRRILAQKIMLLSWRLTSIPKSASKFPISTCRSSITRREFLVAQETVFRSRWSRGGGGGRVSSLELSRYRRHTSLTRAVTACISRRAMYTGIEVEES